MITGCTKTIRTSIPTLNENNTTYYGDNDTETLYDFEVGGFYKIEPIILFMESFVVFYDEVNRIIKSIPNNIELISQYRLVLLDMTSL
jgi:hypothetical protein